MMFKLYITPILYSITSQKLSGRLILLSLPLN